MKKAYQFRIYPTKNQEVILNRTLSTCRHLYNDSLAERKRQAELNRLKREFQVFPFGKPEWISYEDQANSLTELKTQLQKEVYSQVLQNVLKRLDRSFQNFFNGSGYPRFKGRNQYNTFTYPQSGFELNGMTITLSKIGNIRIFQHRKMEGKIKTCTIKKDIDQWYVIFTVEIDRKIEKVPVKTRTGIDVGLESLITLSNGEQINNMVQNHHLAKSIMDAGWGQIIRFTAYKAAYAGKTVELVDPRYTSQTCLCGHKVPKTLKVRVHQCPECGLILNRDHVSAILIERKSKCKNINVPADCGELTPVKSIQKELSEAGSLTALA